MKKDARKTSRKLIGIVILSVIGIGIDWYFNSRFVIAVASCVIVWSALEALHTWKQQEFFKIKEYRF